MYIHIIRNCVSFLVIKFIELLALEIKVIAFFFPFVKVLFFFFFSPCFFSVAVSFLFEYWNLILSMRHSKELLFSLV